MTSLSYLQQRAAPHELKLYGVKFWTFKTALVLVFDQWQATERICDYYDGYIQWRSL